MAKIKTILLTQSEQAALEKGWRTGPTFAYRQRCHLILLKAQCRTSKDVAQQIGCCEVVVNNGLKRYQEQGIDGLKTRAGRGRPSILQTEGDLETVRRVVAAHRQRLSHAKAELETELGKEFSALTLKRFLKKTIVATNACVG